MTSKLDSDDVRLIFLPLQAVWDSSVGLTESVMSIHVEQENLNPGVNILVRDSASLVPAQNIQP